MHEPSVTRRLVLAAAISVCLVGAPARASTPDAAVVQALQKGGKVILLRHAATPPGLGDPPGYTLADCASQRNLSQAGIDAARAQSAVLKAARVRIDHVQASPWCRTIDTARLLTGREPELEASLGSFYDESMADARARASARVIATTLGWRGAGNLLMVTHGVNISALVGRLPAMGEGVVIDPTRSTPQALHVVGVLPP